MRRRFRGDNAAPASSTVSAPATSPASAESVDDPGGPPTPALPAVPVYQAYTAWCITVCVQQHTPPKRLTLCLASLAATEALCSLRSASEHHADPPELGRAFWTRPPPTTSTGTRSLSESDCPTRSPRVSPSECERTHSRRTPSVQPQQVVPVQGNVGSSRHTAHTS